jgi:Sensors of blue-light using FAD
VVGDDVSVDLHKESLRTTLQLRSVAYVSKATRRFTEADLRRLSMRAAQFNDTVDVTDLLLFSGDAFLQTIEGLGVNVEKAYVRISNDASHDITDVLIDARTP